MGNTIKLAIAAVLFACAFAAQAQQRPQPAGPVASDMYTATLIRIDQGDEGLLYEPVHPGPNARIGLVTSHPDGNVFTAVQAVEMARRGYRVLAVNHHGSSDDVTVFGQPLSKAIEYLRARPGIEKVLIMGHSGGGHLIAWYGNVAEHGPAACDGPEKLYPCDGKGLTGLSKPDGVILLDSTLGAFHEASAVDPAVDGDQRIASLDMFAAANGYDAAAKDAKYSAEFAKRFYAAQSARNNAIVSNAVARLNALKAGKGEFTDDEPLLIKGMGEDAAGARLYQPDPSYASHTKKPHTLLKADGTVADEIVHSVRGATGQQYPAQLNTLRVMNTNTTVKDFLAHSAIRLKPDFAITADNIVGVEWASAVNSTPANAEGISVPMVIVSNTCHYLMMQDEIVYDNLGAKDKTLAYVEGSTHMFTPCKTEYGDTAGRAFDFVDKWVNKSGRF